MEVTDPLEMAVQDVLGFDGACDGWRSARIASALRRADDAQCWLLAMVLGADERSAELVLRRWASQERARAYYARYARAKRSESFATEDTCQTETDETAEEPQPMRVQHGAHGCAGDATSEQDAG